MRDRESTIQYTAENSTKGLRRVMDKTGAERQTGPPAS